MDNKFAKLAKGSTGKLLIELLKDVQNKVADIRTPMSVKQEHEQLIRLGVIQVIEEQLIAKLLMHSGELAPPDLNDHV